MEWLIYAIIIFYCLTLKLQVIVEHKMLKATENKVDLCVLQCGASLFGQPIFLVIVESSKTATATTQLEIWKSCNVVRLVGIHGVTALNLQHNYQIRRKTSPFLKISKICVGRALVFCLKTHLVFTTKMTSNVSRK